MALTLTRSKSSSASSKAKGKKGKKGAAVEGVDGATETPIKPPSPVLIFLAKQFPSVFKSVPIDSSAVAAATMSKLPLVNMLPPLMVLQVKRRAIIRQFMAMFGGLMFIFAGLWFVQGTSIQVAALSLESTQAQVQNSIERVEELKGISSYFDNLQARMNVGAAAYMEQADYSVILGEMQRLETEGITINGMQMVYVPLSEEKAPACGQDGSPFAVEPVRVLGCIEWSGMASDRAALAEYIRTLETAEYLQLPFINLGGESEEGISFTGSAGIRQSANLGEAASGLVDGSGAGLEPADPNALFNEEGEQPADGTAAAPADPAATDPAAPADPAATGTEGAVAQ